MDASQETAKGSCLCGAVTYRIRKPYLFFQYCHCSRCRKESGSAHGAKLLLPVAQFEWTGGEAQVQRFELPTAKYFCTAFCKTCGSSLPWQTRNGKYMIVPCGTLDEDPGARPERNVHWDSHAPWYVSAEQLPFFEQEP